MGKASKVWLMRFVLRRRVDRQWYFEVQAGGNWETLVVSEGYKRKRDARRAIRMLQEYAFDALVSDRSRAV